MVGLLQRTVEPVGGDVDVYGVAQYLLLCVLK